MSKHSLTNQQVAFLMSDCQKFWLKWRDKVKNTDESWQDVLADASIIFRKHGDVSRDFVSCFITLLADRANCDGGSANG